MAIARPFSTSEQADLPAASILPAPPSGGLELDAFAFHTGAASRIAGLGGSGPKPSPDYVFHTPYVEAAPGIAHFTLRFDALQAKIGTLIVRVHMLSNDAEARSRLVNSERIAFNRLIQRGSELAVRFESFHGMSYALVGLIQGDTDAKAVGLAVTLDRPADPDARPETAAEARSTAYGNTPIQATPNLLSTAAPSLTDPVTQVATAAQLREPVATGWMARLRPKGSSGPEHWRKIYTLQVLQRYGMLEPGAVGLGFELSASGVPAALADMDVNVSMVFPVRPDEPPSLAGLKEDLWGRAPCDRTRFDENISVRLASWRRLPEDLVNFDFLWSARVNERMFSVAATVGFIEDAMTCLRPGGLAVHVLSYDLAPSGRATSSLDRLLLQQGDVERIALQLVSRGHEVAQFRIRATDPILGAPGHGVERRTMVGIVARKARLLEG